MESTLFYFPPPCSNPCISNDNAFLAGGEKEDEMEEEQASGQVGDETEEEDDDLAAVVDVDTRRRPEATDCGAAPMPNRQRALGGIA